MTRTIKSFTSNKTYSLTIDSESGRAIDCSCPDMRGRGHRIEHISKGGCKHMQEYEVQLQRAAAFILIERMVRETEASNRFNRERAAMLSIYNMDNLG